MSEFTDDAISRYIGQTPERRKAHMLDPAAHLQAEVMRQTLDAVERAMVEERMPEETRRRVVNRVVWGEPEGLIDVHAKVRLEREELHGAYEFLSSQTGVQGLFHDPSAGLVCPGEETST